MLFPGCISGDPAPMDPNPLDNSPPSCCNPTSENFVTHDSEDEDAYQDKLEDWLDENDEDDMVTLESNQVHFMYSSVDTDFKQIILQMDLSEEEVLLITFYDNEWHMFPDEIEIKAGQGYFVITLYGDVNSFGLTTSEVEYGGNMMTLTNGWNLIAFNDDFSQSAGISNIWKIKDNQAYSVDDFDDVDGNMVWLKYSEQVDDDSDNDSGDEETYAADDSPEDEEVDDSDDDSDNDSGDEETYAADDSPEDEEVDDSDDDSSDSDESVD